MTVTWPTTQGGLLLWMELLFAWVVANYVIGTVQIPWKRRSNNRPVVEISPADTRFHAVILALATLVLLGPNAPGFLLAVVLGIITWKLPWLRGCLARVRRESEAEVEVVVNLIVIAFSGLLIEWYSLEIWMSFFVFPIPENRLAVICAIASSFCFIVRGGTLIVRGYLGKFQAFPIINQRNDGAAEERGQANQNKGRIDSKELSRGRFIGNVERLFVLLLVLMEEYAAIGLLIAAKSWVRGKQFEDRDFAEYFLIGTLVSLAVAFIVGIGLRSFFLSFWSSYELSGVAIVSDDNCPHRFTYLLDAPV